MNKKSLMQVNKFLCGLLLSLVVFLLPLCLCGCKDDPQLSEEEIMTKMIQNTSQQLAQIDDEIISQNQGSSAQPASTTLTEAIENVYPAHSKIDRGSNQYVYRPVSQMTISYGYYALCEYYLKYVQFFMNKTLHIHNSNLKLYRYLYSCVCVCVLVK